MDFQLSYPCIVSTLTVPLTSVIAMPKESS